MSFVGKEILDICQVYARYMNQYVICHEYTRHMTGLNFLGVPDVISLATPASFPTTLELSLALELSVACSSLPLSSLLDCQTTQVGLAAPKLPQPMPSLPSAAAVSAHPNGKPESLRLLNMCGIVGVELPSRKHGIRGTLPAMFSAGATSRHGVGAGSYSLITPARMRHPPSAP